MNFEFAEETARPCKVSSKTQSSRINANIITWEDLTLSALIITTKSPQSPFGRNVGLCFPRNIGAMVVARRPTVWFVASTRCHVRWRARPGKLIVGGDDTYDVWCGCGRLGYLWLGRWMHLNTYLSILGTSVLCENKEIVKSREHLENQILFCR